MIAAVAALSFAYFVTIELMAFSYAISGCSFSMSEIQIERNPFHRLPRREMRPMSFLRSGVAPDSSVSAVGLVESGRVADHPRHRFLSEELQHLLHFELSRV